MAVAAGARKPAPLAPIHHTPQASPSAGAPDRSPLHHHERGSPMKNRKREICTSGHWLPNGSSYYVSSCPPQVELPCYSTLQLRVLCCKTSRPLPAEWECKY